MQQQLSHLKDLNLLYVEDNEDVRRVTSMILEDYMDRIFLAKNGAEALEIFKTHNIDVVLTDILMPKMNGIELARKIRNSKTAPNCPIIITTAHTEVNYLLEAIELRIDGYILKPLNVNNLLESIHKALLPKIQSKELESKNLLLKVISTFVGGKKIEIIKFLLENSDKDNVFYGSYEYIIAQVNVSKPTIVKTFRQLIDVGLLVKIKNKVYKIHPDVATQE